MFAALATTLCLAAQTPFVQTWYTSDPAPMVHNGTLYVYTGHDEDRAWASQCIERNGKFYWYICAHSRLSSGMAIGVAVSDSPTGPFRDAIGKPLFENGSWDHIDPTVMIDSLPLPPSQGGGTKQQAWIMWGNPQVYYAKLNDDMISIDGEVQKLDMTEEAFGGPITTSSDRTTT